MSGDGERTVTGYEDPYVDTLACGHQPVDVDNEYHYKTTSVGGYTL